MSRTKNSARVTTGQPPDPGGKWRAGLTAFGMLLTVTAAAGYGLATGDFEILKTVVISIAGAVVAVVAGYRTT